MGEALMAPIGRLIRELRWWASRDDIDHDLVYTCDDTADALNRACKLAGALDKYTREPNARNWTDVLHARKAFK